jgi:hypothetical protein
LQGVKGQTVSAEAKAAVLARMLALGALAPTNPSCTPKKALEATLGVYRFDPLDCHELDLEAGAAALL